MARHGDLEVVDTPSGGSSKPKSRSARQDDSIMGTNNSSIVSKRSVERLYYANEPQLFRHFVKKPQRRSPLINRGYWLRMKAVDQVIRHFLEKPSSKPKFVLNLGCGYDPLPWQCLARFPSACEGVTFIDIDYRDLIIKKRDIVKNTTELSSVLQNIKTSEGDILLSSDKYLQIGCDLRDLTSLRRILAGALEPNKCEVLFAAEVSITYMDVNAADELIGWATIFPEATFCLLEQLLPDGHVHPFAHTMTSHFNKLRTPLRAVDKYPTILKQQARFRSLGWTKVSIRNLWELWNSPDFISTSERKSLDNIEPFDEWEEFALFGCHYFILVANNYEYGIVSQRGVIQTEAQSIPGIKMEATYLEHPKGLGYRRFAAPILVSSPDRTQDRMGNFGGTGLTTRLNTYDEYCIDRTGPLVVKHHGSHVSPSSRMCHSITDIGDTGALLVGGRTSPDNALLDCWLYHKWLGIWERVDNLPFPLYRHQAVSVGNGSVLVSTGRIDSKTISSVYLVWNRRWGWVKCSYGIGDIPPTTYGAIFFASRQKISKDEALQCRGILAGGISTEGLLQQQIWQWEINLSAKPEPLISFQKSVLQETAPHIARFGASIAHHQGQTYIFGGIIKDQILKGFEEIYAVNDQGDVISSVMMSLHSSYPRPLLIGSTVMSSGESLIIMGGGAVCFSFGTFWNKGCYTLRAVENPSSEDRVLDKQIKESGYGYLRTVTLSDSIRDFVTFTPPPLVTRTLKSVPRLEVRSPADFEQLLLAGNPVIIQKLNLGTCTSKWSFDYLKETVGIDREVIIHEATTEHMSFKSKNFVYVPKRFGEFLDQITRGDRLYLRSLSSVHPSEVPADIARDFPSIAPDFQLPPELRFVAENIHSSPLRISGPVSMWLHYDVMANVLCQIRGSKRLLLFPPTDVRYFDIDPGASSSQINVFEKLHDPSLAPTRPHEAILSPGDTLFVPPFWLHTASPISEVSIGVNVFFRSLPAGYTVGKDVYGNRDLHAYEKGRQDISKIIRSFDNLPSEVREFYLQRLVDEFKKQAC